jgi:hypothetical protein
VGKKENPSHRKRIAGRWEAGGGRPRSEKGTEHERKATARALSTPALALHLLALAPARPRTRHRQGSPPDLTAELTAERLSARGALPNKARPRTRHRQGSPRHHRAGLGSSAGIHTYIIRPWARTSALAAARRRLAGVEGAPRAAEAQGGGAGDEAGLRASTSAASGSGRR